MSRLRGAVVFVVGLVLIILGIGMWQNPNINWRGFVGTWSSIIDGIGKLVHEPFAALGIVVLVVGFMMAIGGFRRMVRGQSK